MASSVAPSHSDMFKVERVLPIAVDAVNDPPKVVMPHHHVIKFGAFGIWSRYLTTQAELSATNGNLTVGISTDTNSGQVVLHGVSAENVTFQVYKTFHGRNPRILGIDASVLADAVSRAFMKLDV